MIVAEIAFYYSIKNSAQDLILYFQNSKVMSNKFWKAVALVSGIYIFIPEVTDVVPVIGWLDEATALGILMYALKKMGYDLKFPFRKKQTPVS